MGRGFVYGVGFLKTDSGGGGDFKISITGEKRTVSAHIRIRCVTKHNNIDLNDNQIGIRVIRGRDQFKDSVYLQ